MKDPSRESEARVARAEERRRMCARLLSNLVHQVSQPLTVMVGLLESGLSSSLSQSQYRSVLETSLREADRLSRLVRRTREVAEMESNPAAPRTVRLVRTVSKAVTKMAPWAELKGLKIRVHAPGEILVRFDPLRLEWAIQQLISRSMRRSQEGGDVRILISHSKAFATLTLVHQGANASSKTLENWLSPSYWSFSTARDSEVDGLEWELAQWVLGPSGANLAVANKPKCRCAVTVTLPLGIRKSK